MIANMEGAAQILRNVELDHFDRNSNSLHPVSREVWQLACCGGWMGMV